MVELEPQSITPTFIPMEWQFAPETPNSPCIAAGQAIAGRYDSGEDGSLLLEPMQDAMEILTVRSGPETITIGGVVGDGWSRGPYGDSNHVSGLLSRFLTARVRQIMNDTHDTSVDAIEDNITKAIGQCWGNIPYFINYLKYLKEGSLEDQDIEYQQLHNMLRRNEYNKVREQIKEMQPVIPNNLWDWEVESMSSTFALGVIVTNKDGEQQLLHYSVGDSSIEVFIKQPNGEIIMERVTTPDTTLWDDAGWDITEDEAEEIEEIMEQQRQRVLDISIRNALDLNDPNAFSEAKRKANAELSQGNLRILRYLSGKNLLNRSMPLHEDQRLKPNQTKIKLQRYPITNNPIGEVIGIAIKSDGADLLPRSAMEERFNELWQSGNRDVQYIVSILLKQQSEAFPEKLRDDIAMIMLLLKTSEEEKTQPLVV